VTEVLTARDFKAALDVQDACNLSGVLHTWAKLIDKIWAEARENKLGTADVNTHPINVLFASKVASLTGCELSAQFSEAYRAAEHWSKDDEDMKTRNVPSSEISSETLRAEDHMSDRASAGDPRTPDCTHGWEIVNREHFESVLTFAVKVEKMGSLVECLDRLQAIAGNYKGKVSLFADWAPYSFEFSIVSDGRCVLNGGVIFHGKHDNGGDGGAPTFSVSLSPVDGWSIHT